MDFPKDCLGILLLAVTCLVHSATLAQAETTTAPANDALHPISDGVVHVAAGTFVVLRIEAPISSKTARQGEAFDITLAQDLVVSGRIVVKAGARGKGQVVHSAGTGFGGRAGELILAARYIEAPTGHLKLRGFSLAKAGANNTAEALLIPVAGLFITGTSAEVKAGQLGIAKTREVFEIKP